MTNPNELQRKSEINASILAHAVTLSKHGRGTGEIPNAIPGVHLGDLRSLHKIMVSDHVSLALVTLQKAGFFHDLIPEIQESIDLKSSKSFKAIWPHTVRVVNQTPPKLILRWAALFHDLGKAQSFEIINGKVTFRAHEYLSAKIFNRFASRSDIFSKSQRSRIGFLIANLGYVEGYSSKWTDSAVRRFARDMGNATDDLLDLSRADITTSKIEKRDKIWRGIERLRVRIAEIKESDSKKPALPKGIGTAIAEEFNLPNGPEIGKLKRLLESRVESGELESGKDFEYYMKSLKSSDI